MTVLDPPADTDVLVASRHDPQAFVLVFDAHFPALHGYLRRRLGEPLAEELAAETFTRDFEVRERFDPDRWSSPRTDGSTGSARTCDPGWPRRSSPWSSVRSSPAIRASSGAR